MTVHLTPAEAKKLGITTTGKERPAPSGSARRSRKTRGEYRSRCMTCGDEFTTMASETRHVEDTLHARYEMVRE